MRPLVAKLKPASGFANFVHIALQLLIPVLAYVLVRAGFPQLALSVIILSKWRMFAVRPRFWAANIRANAVDLMVGISLVLFMIYSTSMGMQLLWTALYAVWLVFIKPGSSLIMISLQAFIAQFVALTALYLVWIDGPLIGQTVLVGLICYLAARHFFDGFNEPYTKLLSYIWGYFAAALAWLLGHWLLVYYDLIAQPTLLLSTLGYGLAALYYLDHRDRLSKGIRLQFVFIMMAIVLVVLTLSDWGDQVI